MSKPTKTNPAIKYVKKASQWVRTYFEGDKRKIERNKSGQWRTT